MGVLAFALGGVGVRQLARAQDGAPGPQGGGAPGPGFPGRMMGGGGGAQIAASGTNVFVLRGNTIYRLDAATLAVRAQAELPAPEGGPQPQAQNPGEATGADPALIAHGRQVFGTAGCTNCHRFNGQGTGRAPDLGHVGSEPGHTAEFIASYVHNPQAVNPAAKMPAFGGKLPEADINAVATFLAAQK
jgi:mono/diheme cytochrome c family protein